MISPPVSILFDKGVVRRVYEAQYRRGRGEWPTFLQTQAVAAFVQLRAPERQLYITPPSANVLQLRRPQYADTILSNTAVLCKGRYLSRWARPLRDYAFAREDAIILAYGSFGVDLSARTIGAEVIVTGDLKLATNFNTRLDEIRARFDHMVVNLPELYNQATLPAVITTVAVMTTFK